MYQLVTCNGTCTVSTSLKSELDKLSMQREVGGVVHIFFVNGKPGLHSKGRLQSTGIPECTMTLLVLFFEAE